MDFATECCGKPYNIFRFCYFQIPGMDMGRRLLRGFLCRSCPPVGEATMVALIVTGQMAAGVLLNHFGLIGYATHLLNL